MSAPGASALSRKQKSMSTPADEFSIRVYAILFNEKADIP
jgi:hypothetical protein